MSKKTLGIVLIVVGALVVVACLAADTLGVGNGTGIGWKQVVGAVVGLVVLLAGVWLPRMKTS